MPTVSIRDWQLVVEVLVRTLKFMARSQFLKVLRHKKKL